MPRIRIVLKAVIIKDRMTTILPVRLFIISLFVFTQSFSGWAVDYKLSDLEQSALESLNLSESDIQKILKNSNTSLIKDKLKNADILDTSEIEAKLATEISEYEKRAREGFALLDANLSKELSSAENKYKESIELLNSQYEKEKQKITSEKDKIELEARYKQQIDAIQARIDNTKSDIKSKFEAEKKAFTDKMNAEKAEIEDRYKTAIAKLEDKKTDILDKIEDGKDEITGVITDKKDELTKRLEEEKAKLDAEKNKLVNALMNDGEDVLMGYAASTISLIVMAIFAPSVIRACGTKPSAIAYAGTAAVYLVKELSNSQKFKTETLSEIEYVQVNLDSSKGIRENVNTLKTALNTQLDLVERYKGYIDKAIQSIEEKAKSARIAAIGFTASSAVALAETFGVFGGGACTGAGGVTPAKVSDIDLLKEQLISLIIARAHAESEITIKKHTLSAELQKSYTRYLSDTDKIFALLVGGGSLAASMFIPSYDAMLKKIMSSGVSRSIVFAANGAVAYAASRKFQESSDSLKAKSARLQEVIDNARKAGNDGFDIAEDVLDKRDVSEVIDLVEGKGRVTNEDIERLKSEINGVDSEKIQESLENLNIPKDVTTSFLNWLIPNAHAQAPAVREQNWRCYDPIKCNAPVVPRINHPAFQGLNQFLTGFNNYSRSVYKGTPQQVREWEQKLFDTEDHVTKAKEKLEEATNKKRVSSGERPIPFSDLIQNEAKNINGMIKKSVVADNKNLVASASKPSASKSSTPNAKPTSGQQNVVAESNKRPTLSKEQYQALNRLVARIEAGLRSDSSYLDKDYSYNLNLHPEDVSLFDVLNHRYRLIFSPR